MSTEYKDYRNTMFATRASASANDAAKTGRGVTAELVEQGVLKKLKSMAGSLNTMFGSRPSEHCKSAINVIGKAITTTEEVLKAPVNDNSNRGPGF